MLDFVAEHKIEVTTNVVHGLEEVPQPVHSGPGIKIRGKTVVLIDEGAEKVFIPN